MKKPIVINGAFLDDRVLESVASFQDEEYRRRYEDALLKVMETFIVGGLLTSDEEWEIIRTFADLRHELRDFRKPEQTDEIESP